VHNIPGVSKELKGEKEDRINILVLGMRGADLPGGGNLADSIEVVSIKPKENKISMLSIPRDLYVTDPGTQDKSKINAVHAYGEQKGKGKGLEDMKTVVSQVTGLPIHYAVSINFAGFKQLIDAVGGIQLTLDQPFDESMQFNEPQVCDPEVFTVPTGEFQTKTKKIYDKVTGKYARTRVTARYPLCTNPSTECGGNFKLPAGTQTLSGEQALCYSRARVQTSDFERAKRQQQIMLIVKQKMKSIGTLADFSKVNAILNTLGDNVRTDMQPWEMQQAYELYKNAPGDQSTYQHVLENSDEGLLYNPPEGDAGYILLPIGDNYDKIHDLAQNIFDKPAQSDIKPK
jgi:LCP family protein required for cell wall assembly